MHNSIKANNIYGCAKDPVGYIMCNTIALYNRKYTLNSGKIERTFYMPG